MALLSMRLPRPLLHNPFFQFSRIDELILALANEVDANEILEIRRLHALGLPPITSVDSISAMFGINPGFVWSLINKKSRYYRYFRIKKGRGFRVIQAPRVALKIIQKWLAIRLSEGWRSDSHVYGFVAGRSHVDAAFKHCGSEWVFSCDLENFFPSTPEQTVAMALKGLGYNEQSSRLIASICCCEGGLAQGSPASPVLSNICAHELDKSMILVEEKYSCVYTRYADDIVFSGKGPFPESLQGDVFSLIDQSPWNLSEGKTVKMVPPMRLKVHGLLVDRDTPRLTKGYRNRIRAYRHLECSGKLKRNESIVRGHIAYADFVEKLDS